MKKALLFSILILTSQLNLGQTLLVNENIQSWTARASYGSWTQSITAGTVNMTACIVQPAATANGTGSIGRVQMQAANGILELPQISSVSDVEFHFAAGGAGRTIILQSFNGSTWDNEITFTGIGTTGATYTFTIDQNSPIILRLSSPSAALYVHDIIITSFASIPTLTVSPTTLSGFTYVFGSGPSTSQNYSLSGTDLNGSDVTVTAPTNYEISLNDADWFASRTLTAYDGTNTNIYVRLKSILSVGNYNGETISNSGGGATAQNVTLNGSVTSASIISVTPTTLTGFTYVLGSGPSASQSYVLSGTSLDGSDVTITAPTNYEISINDADWFTSRTLTAYDGTNTNIYVRLKADRSVGNYNNEIISNAGGGATTVNVTCNGSVTGVPLPVVEDFNYTNSTNLTDNSWIAHSAAGTNPITVTSPGLTYEGYASSGIGNAVLLDNTGEDVSKLFGIESSGVIYYSFLVNVTTGTEGYFIHLGNNATAFAARVYVKPSSTTGKINFGISNTSTASYATTPTDFDLLTTYLVIVKYNVSTMGEASLWVLSSGVPASELAAGIPEHTTSGTGLATIERICLRQYILTQNIIVDGIRVATEWSQAPLPVELSSFSASVVGNTVKLNWKTETEVNNYGFEVERYALSAERQAWVKIGFVNGSGNSNSPKSYSFVDDKVTAGKYSYRLKQIDSDGQFEYSKTIEVDFGTPGKFELTQNFPNPFNPETAIRFTLPTASSVKLTVFNLLGQEVKLLVNEYKEAGTHIINFNASDFNSGVYIYRLETNGITQTRKMTLVK